MIKEERGKSVGYCNCGFKRTAGMEISSSEKNNSEKMKRSADALKDDESSGFEHECPKCGHTHAEVKELGEILDDESSVCLYTCKKCGHVAREKGSG
jgi:DNA-directed RNA polymerase subunit M/transcription elongation factor TFIIS